jgi:hypothetical protein
MQKYIATLTLVVELSTLSAVIVFMLAVTIGQSGHGLA